MIPAATTVAPLPAGIGKPVLTHASFVCDMLASLNLANFSLLITGILM